MNKGDGYFEITCVHRDDVRAALMMTEEQAAQITDEMMEAIAKKMADDYCTQLFHISLQIIAKEVIRGNLL